MLPRDTTIGYETFECSGHGNDQIRASDHLCLIQAEWMQLFLQLSFHITRNFQGPIPNEEGRVHFVLRMYVSVSLLGLFEFHQRVYIYGETA